MSAIAEMMEDVGEVFGNVPKAEAEFDRARILSNAVYRHLGSELHHLREEVGDDEYAKLLGRVEIDQETADLCSQFVREEGAFERVADGFDLNLLRTMLMQVLESRSTGYDCYKVQRQAQLAAGAILRQLRRHLPPDVSELLEVIAVSLSPGVGQGIEMAEPYADPDGSMSEAGYKRLCDDEGWTR